MTRENMGASLWRLLGLILVLASSVDSYTRYSTTTRPTSTWWWRTTTYAQKTTTFYTLWTTRATPSTVSTYPWRTASTSTTTKTTKRATTPWWWGPTTSAYTSKRPTTTYPTTKTHLRLVNGTDAYSGRVEVYYQGQWGTICDDYFDERDATVICNMLNLRDSNSNVAPIGMGHFGAGNGRITIDDLNCHGYETDIVNCPSNAWLTHNCDHSEDAWVDCRATFGVATSIWQSRKTNTASSSQPTSTPRPHTMAYTTVPYRNTSPPPTPTALTSTPIRLMNGWDMYSGRVEVYYQGQWGSICDDNFDNSDAEVICRMLNYLDGYSSSNAKAYSYAHFGPSHGRITIDMLGCRGDEIDIADCNSRTWLNIACSHSEDAGVDCRANSRQSTTTPRPTMAYAMTTRHRTQLRLVNGHDAYSGRVEVYYQGQWGTICDDSFDHDDATVICNMLNLRDSNSVVAAYGNARFGEGHGRITLDDLGCSGYESDISGCSSRGWLSHNCGHSEDAGVDCRAKIRLVNGTDMYSGRVEVYYHGEWGTICDDRFDENDARVICRTLNFLDGHSSVKPYSNAYFGEGYDNITIDELNCRGYETDIVNCPSNSWLTNDCSHSEDAGVDCRANGNDLTTEEPATTDAYAHAVRLVGGHNTHSGRVEVFDGNMWRGVCNNGLDHSGVKVICRQLGLYYGNSHGAIYTDNRFGTRYVQNTLTISCNGYESSISGCSKYYHTTSCYEVGIDCGAYRNDWTTQSTHQPSTTESYGSLLSQAIHVDCDESGWNINVDMHRIVREYPSAVASDIYLGENSCTGSQYSSSLRFRQGLRECLTSEIIRNDVLVYSNELVYAQHDPNHPFRIINYNWTVPVECDVDRNASSHGHLHHIDHSVTAAPPVVGHNQYTVNMKFYSDPNFMNEIRGNPLQVAVGSQVYVRVYSTMSDWEVKMRVHTCYTKPSQSAADHLKYYIIKNGCEVDSNTHYLSQSAHETHFVFQDFEYTTNHEGIELKCDASFCGTNDYSAACSQTCNPVVKRSVRSDDP